MIALIKFNSSCSREEKKDLLARCEITCLCVYLQCLMSFDSKSLMNVGFSLTGVNEAGKLLD